MGYSKSWISSCGRMGPSVGGRVKEIQASNSAQQLSPSGAPHRNHPAQKPVGRRSGARIVDQQVCGTNLQFFTGVCCISESRTTRLNISPTFDLGSSLRKYTCRDGLYRVRDSRHLSITARSERAGSLDTTNTATTSPECSSAAASATPDIAATTTSTSLEYTLKPDTTIAVSSGRFQSPRMTCGPR